MVELEVMGVSMDGQHQPVVLLRHEDRVLPIVVGLAEAEAIHSALINRDLGRPMTHFNSSQQSIVDVNDALPQDVLVTKVQADQLTPLCIRQLIRILALV